jgi:DNA-3-methyladenine glycosylase II
MSKPAIRHLSAVDPVMRALIRRVGPCGLAVRNHSPFETLVRAIAHQQIHGRAAEAILGRFIALFPDRRFPTPDDIAAVDPRKLRRAGFSRAKTRSIKDIARKTRRGLIPTRRACHRFTDAELIARLVQVRGVGQWTVEMLLLFTLGRPDVLPVDDFGCARAKIAYGGGSSRPRSSSGATAHAGALPLGGRWYLGARPRPYTGGGAQSP